MVVVYFQETHSSNFVKLEPKITAMYKALHELEPKISAVYKTLCTKLPLFFLFLLFIYLFRHIQILALVLICT